MWHFFLQCSSTVRLLVYCFTSLEHLRSYQDGYQQCALMPTFIVLPHWESRFHWLDGRAQASLMEGWETNDLSVWCLSLLSMVLRINNVGEGSRLPVGHHKVIMSAHCHKTVPILKWPQMLLGQKSNKQRHEWS